MRNSTSAVHLKLRGSERCLAHKDDIGPWMREKNYSCSHACVSLLFGLLCLCLGGCGKSKPNVGEIAIKALRGVVLQSIVIDTDTWVTSDASTFTPKDNGAPIVAYRTPGKYILQIGRDNKLTTVCKFEVKRDRLVTITLKAAGRDITCQIVD
jgi:hypothetical protein